MKHSPEMNPLHISLKVLIAWIAVGARSTSAVRARDGLPGAISSAPGAPQLTIRLAAGSHLGTPPATRTFYLSPFDSEVEVPNTDSLSLFQKRARKLVANQTTELAANTTDRYKHMTLKFAANQMTQSQGALVPIILVVLAVTALICISYLMLMMMGEKADTTKTAPPAPFHQAAASTQSKPQVVQRSPAAQALLPHNSPVQGSVQPQPAGIPVQPATSPLESTQQAAFHAAFQPAVLESTAAPHTSLLPRSATRSSPAAGACVDQHAASGFPQIGYTPKSAITSNRLDVQSPEGMILQADYKCSHHPEQRLVNFKSLKGGNAVLRARIDEISGKRQITVETTSGIPLALIDTTKAVFERGFVAPSRNQRYASIHRVAGKSFSLLGSPCITVSSVALNVFKVLSANGLGSNSDELLTVRCDELGYVRDMRDPSGVVVVRQESNTVMEGRSSLWISQGVDIALISCVVLAVGKLGGQ